MAVTTTPTIGLKKPDDTEFYDIGVQNANNDLIDKEFAEVASRMVSMVIDCGTFDDDNLVAAHNASPYAHPNMLVYGGTLEEHMVDQLAHDNIILDGNAGQTEGRAT